VSYIAEKNRFSWLLEEQAAERRDLWDQEVARTESSLGSLVPGWLLVVPRRQMLSLREATMAEQDELLSLVNVLADRLSVFGGDVYAFEHGSAHIGSLSGCGVDQAHLHVVPLPFDLVSVASQAGDVAWKRVSALSLTELPPHREYVGVWRVEDGSGVVGTVSHPVSQWMRRRIATQLGIEEEWNYRTNPKTENIRRTLDALHQRIPPTK
jgi:ATP adenylyltransferase